MSDSRRRDPNLLESRAGRSGDVGRLAGSHWDEMLRATIEKARIDLRRGRLDEVIETLGRHVNEAPPDDEPVAHLLGVMLALYGRALLEFDERPAGLKMLERALTLGTASTETSAGIDPEDAADIAAALRLLNRPAEALKLIESAIQRCSSVPWRVRLEYGRALRLVGRYSEALTQLNTALQDKPGEPFVLFERASCHEQLDQLEQAVQDAIQASVGFISRDRLREADEASAQALRFATTDPAAQGLRAEVLLRLGRPVEALDLARRAIAAGNESAQGMTIQALYRLGRDDESLSAARAVLAHRPDDLPTLEVAADLLVSRGLAVEALELAHGAVDAQPGSADLHLLRGLVFVELRRFHEAEDDLRRAMDLNPGAAEIAAALGRLLLQTERAAEAIPLLRRATAGAAVLVDTLYDLGEALRLTGELAEALEWLDRAVVRNPSHVLAVGTRGQVLVALGRVEEGLTELDRAVDLDRSQAWVQWARAEALAGLGRDADALAAFTAYVTSAPDHLQAGLDVGSRLLELDRADAAVPFLREALTDPARADAVLPNLLLALHATNQWEELISLGRDRTDLSGVTATVVADAYRVTGDYTAAVRVATRVLNQDPGQTFALTVRGEAWRSLSDYDNAERDLRAALAGQHDDPSVGPSLGRVLRLQGRYAEALPLLREAVTDESGSLQYAAELADTLLMLGRPQEALEYSERAVRAFPDQAFEVGVHGAVLRALDRDVEALATIERSLAIEPTAVWVRAEKLLVLLHMHRYAEAAEVGAALAADAADDSYALAVYGLALDANDRQTQALDVIDRSLALSPEAWVRASRGSVLVNLGRREEAIEILQGLIDSGEHDDLWTRVRLAGAYIWKEPPDARAALSVLAEVPDDNPDSVDALCVRGDAHMLLRQRTQASRDYQRVIERTHAFGSREVAALHAVAWALLKLNRIDDAIRNLIRALDQERDAMVQFDLGLVMLHSARQNRALTEYRRAFKLAERLPDPARRRCLVGDALQDLDRALGVEQTLAASTAVDQVRTMFVDEAE